VIVKRKIVAIAMVLSCAMSTLGCSKLFDKNNNNRDMSDRGLNYCFEGEAYDVVEASIDNDITYKAPQIKCESDKNLRAYATESEILFIWLGKKADKINSEDVLAKNSKAITKYICTFADIETVDVSFNLDMTAEDKVNNIDRKKYIGTVNGINRSGIDVAFRTSIYTFVVNGRPGCVLGLVLDGSQSDEKFNEVDANTQVMINSMKVK
jgi:hypothetical protein